MSQRTRPAIGSSRKARKGSLRFALDFAALRIAQHDRRYEHHKKRATHRRTHRGRK